MARLKFKALGADCVIKKTKNQILPNGIPVYGDVFIDCNWIENLKPHYVTDYLFKEGILPEGYVVSIHARNVKT